MTSAGTLLTELRRSNASGIHNHKPSRSTQRRKAIEMTLMNDDPRSLDDIDEPTADDLRQIELDEDDFDADDDYDDYYPENYDDDDELDEYELDDLD